MDEAEFNIEALEQEVYRPAEDLDSGSAYEESSDADAEILSHDENISASHSTSRPRRGGSRKTPVEHFSDEERDLDSGVNSLYTEERIRQDALEWAAKFNPPQEAGVRSPTRHPFNSRSKKRKLVDPSRARAKRLKSFYSNGYRELLNKEIHDAASELIHKDQAQLEKSQIGATIWVSKEKEILFSFLPRLGRDNVRGISRRIGTKSEVEVQEYLQLLCNSRMQKDNVRHQLLDITDLPAAVEISEECCSVLERAADALSSRQERYEEQVEREKWGDSWLLTPEVCQRRNSHLNEGGEYDIKLPALDLLNLKNWLSLSERIFMNSGAPREDDNWQAIAEPGEKPAIRATAFEDFHSLAISFTKRLISTTLFCTMSKLRAMDSNKVKHAEVSVGDVEAAVKVLGLNADRGKFWASCARRCNLKVFENDSFLDSSKTNHMTYDEVEMALCGNLNPDQSIGHKDDSVGSNFSRGEGEENLDLGESHFGTNDVDTEDIDSDDSQISSVGADQLHNISMDEYHENAYLDPSDNELSHRESHRSQILKRISTKKANERTQDLYTEAIDNEASTAEEKHLWLLLKQSPPFGIKSELLELPQQPKANQDNTNEIVDWRSNLDFCSSWKTMDLPVPNESFLRVWKARKRRSLTVESGKSTPRHYSASLLSSGSEGYESRKNADSENEANDGEGSSQASSELEEVHFHPDGRRDDIQNEQEDAHHASMSSGSYASRGVYRSATKYASVSTEPAIKSEPDD